MFLRASLLLTALLLAAPAGAEDAERLEILRAWLADGTAAQAAQAGWAAGERRLVVLRPELEARLRAEGAAETTSPFLADVLLDALMQLRVPVEGRTLVPHADRTATAVLLGLRPTQEPAHLEVFRATDAKGGPVTPTWLAVGGRLANGRSPAFVAEVLGRYRVERRLRVFDVDSSRRSTEFDLPPPVPRKVAPPLVAQIPEGFPPIAVWHASSIRRPGYENYGAGPGAVYAKRYLLRSDGDRRLPSPEVFGRRRDEIRYDWLRGWLKGTSVRDYPRVRMKVDVTWSGGRQVWRRIGEKTYGDLYDAFRGYRNALFAKELLTAEAMADLRPSLRVVVEDCRRFRRQPLPPLYEPAFEPKLPRRMRPHPRVPEGV